MAKHSIIAYLYPKRAVFLLAFLVIAPLCHADQPAPPEAASEIQSSISSVRGVGGVCVTANPLATQACQAALAQGGSAADAALAAAWMLGLVEPQSSGLGGGGYLVYFDGQQVYSFDGRETAPRLAHPRRFLDANQQSISFRQAVSSPAAVGTPSMVRLMQTLHSRFGRLSWASSLQAAQQTAQQGFAVSPRLHQLLSVDQRLRHSNAAQRFYPNGQPLAVGTHYTNPAYAHHLVQLAQHGADWFYRGESAQAIVTALGDQQGLVSREDLSHYQVIEHTPICLPIERHHVCGVAGSSSGGVSVLQALKMLEGHWTDNTPERFTRLTNAQALAFADRNAYLADPDFVSVPFQQLLDPQYLKQRQTQALEPNALGNPTAGLFAQAASAAGVDTPNTSHISVVDQYGQAASLTLSIESAFGSQIWVEAGGFFLNNQLTDFSFQPHDNGQLVANRVQGGKRPRSSMSPTLVLDQSQTQVIGVIGSPGGSQIIGFVTHALWQLLNQQSVAQVLNTGHVLRRGQSTELESDRFDFSMQHALAQRGHRLISQPMTSGLAIIWRDAQGQWVAGADPRREGTAQLAPSTKSIPNQD